MLSTVGGTVDEARVAPNLEELGQQSLAAGHSDPNIASRPRQLQRLICRSPRALMASGVLTAPKPTLQHGCRIRTELGAVCILVGRHDLQGGVKPAPIAQSAERLHGKEKVCGSIPHGGSVRLLGATAHRRNTAQVDV